MEFYIINENHYQDLMKLNLLWAPMKDKKGNADAFYELTGKIRKNDIMLICAKKSANYKEIVAIAVATSDVVSGTVPPIPAFRKDYTKEDGSYREGYSVNCTYITLQHAVALNEVMPFFDEAGYILTENDRGKCVPAQKGAQAFTMNYCHIFTRKYYQLFNGLLHQIALKNRDFLTLLDDCLKSHPALDEPVSYMKKYAESRNYPKNLILYGPPGTGKTYHSVIYAVAFYLGMDVEDIKKYSYQDILQIYQELKQTGRIHFTVFHQSYSYEEFIEGIRPLTDPATGQLTYRLENGTFKAFCKEAEKSPAGKFIFVIDEINRGNISRIFGELITLIEEPKRAGAPEAASAVLPYSREHFQVPENVYIIGTMNTADRSIALLDTALRRRFRFIEMLPEPSLLDGVVVRDNGKELPVKDMLETINRRIEFLYDREHQIGHAYFMPLKAHPDIRHLRDIFENAVFPLLQEYFYEDYEKIRLVLGDNDKNKSSKFITEDSPQPAKDFKGTVGEEIRLEKKYCIHKAAFSDIESYTGILHTR